MNVPMDYNDEIERERTHPELFPTDEPSSPVQPAQQFGEKLYRRSVLGAIQNRQTAGSANPSWSQRARGKELPTQNGANAINARHNRQPLIQQ